MKKFQLIPLLIAGAGFWAGAQTPNARLDINSIRAAVHPKNSLFWNGTSLPGYEVPISSGKHTLNACSLWLIGEDLNDVLYGTYNRYGFSDVDTLPGPLQLTTGTTTPAVAAAYKRVWKINQWEIDYLINAQNNGSLASGAFTPPVDILEWPANPPAVGYGDHLAPYFDKNNDNKYNIYDGDYPVIKGEQMLYYIINTRSTATDIQNPGLEIHVSVYACQNPGAPDSSAFINYTTFVEYDIHNRGTVTLRNTYAGFNADGDIGYAFDDYTGSHVDANAFYFYNGDPSDGPGSTPGPDHYGTNWPVQSVQFLEEQADSGQRPMGRFFSYENSAGPTGDPVVGQEYYNMLRGYWRNNSVMVFGGNGFAGSPGATSLRAYYMYPGSSDPDNLASGYIATGFEWTEAHPCPTCPANAPGDRRGVGATGPFTLQPGGSKKIVLGLVTTFDASLSSAGRIEKNRQQNKRLKQWYDAGQLPCVNNLSNKEVDAKAAFKIYPNPATDLVRVSGEGISAGTDYVLLDINGRALQSGKGQQAGTLELDVKGLTAGIYFIRLANTQTGSHIVKFVKN